MRTLLAIVLVFASLLTSGARASTYNYEASFSGRIGRTNCGETCDEMTIFGVAASELVGMDYEIQTSYFAFNVRRFISSYANGHHYKTTWDQIGRVATTINGVTVTAYGVSSALWEYIECSCFYNGLDSSSYHNSFTGESDGMDVSFRMFSGQFHRNGVEPIDGPLFSNVGLQSEYDLWEPIEFGNLSIYNTGYMMSSFQVISAVPLPASLPLMFTALIALFLLNRRRVSAA